MASTTITRATITDDDGSGTTGSVLNASFFGTAIYDKIDALFTATQTIEAGSSGSTLAHQVSNTSNTAGSHAHYVAIVAGSSAGDPFFSAVVQGLVAWSIGADNSDSDSFKITQDVALGGVEDRLIMTTVTRNMGINGQSFGGGVGVVFLANAFTVPSGTPSGGGILYVDAGALKYKGSSGTVTTLANA